jgi:hypothetical protein
MLHDVERRLLPDQQSRSKPTNSPLPRLDLVGDVRVAVAPFNRRVYAQWLNRLAENYPEESAD